MHAPSRPDSKAAKNDQQTRSDAAQDGKMGAKNPNSTHIHPDFTFYTSKGQAIFNRLSGKKNKNSPPCRPCKPKLQFKRPQNRQSTNSIADSAL
jgi:hypothetical protein